MRMKWVLLFLLPVIAAAGPAQVLDDLWNILRQNSAEAWSHSTQGLARTLRPGSVEISFLRGNPRVLEIHGVVKAGSPEQNAAMAVDFGAQLSRLVESRAIAGLRVTAKNQSNAEGAYRVTLQMAEDGVDVERLAALLREAGRKMERLAFEKGVVRAAEQAGEASVASVRSMLSAADLAGRFSLVSREAQESLVAMLAETNTATRNAVLAKLRALDDPTLFKANVEELAARRNVCRR